jgi:hypothetical protein
MHWVTLMHVVEPKMPNFHAFRLQIQAGGGGVEQPGIHQKQVRSAVKEYIVYGPMSLC